MPNEYTDNPILGQIVVIILLVLGGKWLLSRIVHGAVSRMDGVKKGDPSFAERARTLGDVITTTGNIIVCAIAFFMLLEVLNIDTTPLLAGAGIIGLGIGFGSQALVKDFVSGLFILIEDQYRLGEKVKIAGFEGTVKRLTMRLTVVEGEQGDLNFIPNGSVGNVSNLSRQKKPLNT